MYVYIYPYSAKTNFLKACFDLNGSKYLNHCFLWKYTTLGDLWNKQYVNILGGNRIKLRSHGALKSSITGTIDWSDLFFIQVRHKWIDRNFNAVAETAYFDL